MSKIFIALSLVALSSLPLLQAEVAPRCLEYRALTTPSQQPNLVNCPQYRDLSCCDAERDNLILPGNNHTQLYNFNWDQCGALSPACERFFQAESCYFECDPYQGPWANPTTNPAIGMIGVPICASYCNAWFDACKNDFTCATEWMVDFAPVTDSQGNILSYQCSPESQCKTFSDIFDNGQGLCDILWGAAFHYSEDEENCLLWDFPLTLGNPNNKVEKVPYEEIACNIEEVQTPPNTVPVEPKCLAGRALTDPSSQHDLNTCSEYSSMSCCDAKIDQQISRSNPNETFFGYDWNQCGTLSPKCADFFRAQECYFHCDPYNYQWANMAIRKPSTFIGVPLCSSMCDAWFEACKSDMTCGVEWTTDFVPAPGGGYQCASGSQCQTFADVFDNGRGLCEMLWGADYMYSNNPDKCVSWTFKGSNPNDVVIPDVYAAGVCYHQPANTTNVPAIVLGVLFGVTLVALIVVVILFFVKGGPRGKGDIALN